MANDVSYFKIPGDSTQYSFNDADAETTVSTLNAKVGFTTYRNVTNFGLTQGSATIAQAYAAMSNASMLYCPAAYFASASVPSQDGSVLILKPANGLRGFILFCATTGQDYRQLVNASGEPSGTWFPDSYPALNNVQYGTIEAGSNVSVPVVNGLIFTWRGTGNGSISGVAGTASVISLIASSNVTVSMNSAGTSATIANSSNAALRYVVLSF